MNTTTHKDITGSAEVQMGFTALVEAFSNHWLGCGMAATEIQVYTGTSARLFLKEGWLREELRAEGHLFWPAGALQAALLREVEATMRDITDVAEEPIHVSTFPIPHVVSPTPNETIAAREIESQPSTSSPSPAGADAGVSRRGRWDANPVQAPVSDLARDLANMIGALKVHSDVLMEHLAQISAEQELKGWPELNSIENANLHLLRLSSDLHNHLLDYQTSIQFVIFGRRKGVRA